VFAVIEDGRVNVLSRPDTLKKQMHFSGRSKIAGIIYRQISGRSKNANGF
jgi:hypothetical protein